MTDVSNLKPLTDGILSTFQAGYIDNCGSISSLSFHRDGIKNIKIGEYCIAVENKESLLVYDARNGMQTKRINNKATGCKLAIFTHHQSYVLLTSPNNGIISYISLFENKYLCKFKGHEKPYNYIQNSITSLALHSDSNTFITLSDDEFLVWDLRDKNCEGGGSIGDTNPQVAIDSASVFVTASPALGVQLFDLRRYQLGPFKKKKEKRRVESVKSIAFSPDGKYLAYTRQVDQMRTLLFDSFTCNDLRELSYSSFTFIPTLPYLVGIDNKNDFNFYDFNRDRITYKTSSEIDEIDHISFSPTLSVFAAAGDGVSLWIPL